VQVKGLPKGLKEVAEFPDGSIALECQFCEGTGVFPRTGIGDEDYASTEVCPVCKGSAVNVVPANSEAPMLCRYCKGSGRGWNEDGHFVGEPCRVCGGRGFLDLSALKSGQNLSPQADIWSLMHPDVMTVAKSRFDTGHFADAVEAAFKHFNSTVKKIAGSRVTDDLDGARLMNKVFSPNEPIIKLSDLSTETGKNIQQGYMQMFAGGMMAIRNPKAHANITIDANSAIHLLFVSSLFLYMLADITSDGAV